MPSYDFKCKNCELIFTVNRSMNDIKTPECPNCFSSEGVSRVWNCVNFGGMSSNSSASSCTGCNKGFCSGCK